MKKLTNKPFKKGITFLIIAFVFLTGCSGKPVDQKLEEKQTPVKVATIENSPLTVTKEIVGTMEADVSVQVIPKLAGELVALYVEKGDQVQKGQVLGKIDDRDLRTTVELQKAALEAQKAALEVAIANEKAAKTTVGGEDDTTALNAAKIALEDAERNLARIEALYKEGAVSKTDYEAAVTAERNARLQYEQSKIDIEKAEINVQSSEAQLKQTELSLKQAQDRLDDAIIEATQSGEIVEINAEVGDTVNTQTPLFTIVSLDPMIFQSTVSAEQLALLHEGQKVTISIPALNKTVEGVVSYISSVANQSGLYNVEATVENKDKTIKPGMVGQFLIGQTLVEDALLVPTEAIVEQSGVSKIFIIQDGRAVEKVVEVMESQTEFTAIKGDVSEGDQVVIKGQNTLVDGNLVNIIEEGNES